MIPIGSEYFTWAYDQHLIHSTVEVCYIKIGAIVTFRKSHHSITGDWTIESLRAKTWMRFVHKHRVEFIIPILSQRHSLLECDILSHRVLCRASLFIIRNAIYRRFILYVFLRHVSEPYNVDLMIFNGLFVIFSLFHQ